MKKITLFLLLLFTGWSYGQACTQTFSVSGTDQDNLALTVTSADLSCYTGTVNSITISSAVLGTEFFCSGEDIWYTFELNLDGNTSLVCGSTLTGMDITGFTSLTVTTSDADNAEDDITLSVTVSIDYTAVTPPNCDAALISPADGSTDAPADGVLTWSAATGGAVGYRLSVGTTPGGSEVVNNEDVGNVTTYDIPGILNELTLYYVRITPYNNNGNATGCAEASFTSTMNLAGDFCANAIDLTAETSPLSSTTIGALNDSGTNCNNVGDTITNTAGDLYFKIVVPTGSILTIGQQTNGYDSTNMAFYGDCDNVTELLACNDDDDLEHVTWANTTGTDQTVYWIQDGYNAGQGTFALEWSVIACTPAVAAYTVIPDCENGEQFNVSVEVTDMGSATSISVADDQGSAPQSVTAPGVVQFGPFSNGTQVVFTVANDQDSDCTLTSPAQSQATCPPNCANATVITTCNEVAVADLVGGEGAWNTGSCGYTTNGTELLYSYTPAETGAYVLEVLSASGGYIDYFYKEASGSCDATGWICIDDNSAPGTDPIGTLEAGTTYYILLDGEGTDAKNHIFQIQCLPTCTDATVAYTVVSDCDNGEQFNVSVEISDMGTAVSNTITDDQGSAPQTVTETGTLVFGPYPNNTPVIFTVSNDDDSTCVLTSPVQNQTACPPANDNFADAEAVECDMTYTGSTTLATIDEATAPIGYGVTGTSRNVWYKFTGSGAPQTITLSLCPSEYDTAVLIYTGESGNLTAVAGNDDNGTACPDATTRTQLNFNSDGTTTYYIDLRGYGAFSYGNYSMEVTCADVIPPAVDNQTCDVALNIPTDGSDTISDNSFGDVSPVQPTCDPFGSVQDVWFSFTATAETADVTCENQSMTSLNFNIYSGTCDALVAIVNTCNQNVTTPTTETLTGLVIGATYYVQVWSNADEQGTFLLRVTSEDLGVGGTPFAGFSYSPNPVKDVLHLNYTQNITNVAVYNLLGQQVIAKTINASQSQVDMSKLSAGTYIVKVTADNQVKTIKVIKE